MVLQAVFQSAQPIKKATYKSGFNFLLINLHQMADQYQHPHHSK